MSGEETNYAGTTGGGEKQQSPPVTVETMPEAMTQIKAMLETLVKRIEDHDKQHATANARLETLAAANRNQAGGSGQDRPRRPIRPIPLEFTTPQRTQTGIPPTRPTTVAGEQNPEVQRTGTRNETDSEPVIDLDEENPAQGRNTNNTAPTRNEQRQFEDEIEEEEGRLLAQQTRFENERRAAIRSQIEEMAALRAEMDRTANNLKAVQSQMHRAISKAPEIDRVLEEAQTTPFTARITGVKIADPGKIKIPVYEGSSDPKDHITSFAIAMGRANFREGERDAGQCLLFVEHLKGPALQWFSRLDRNSIDSFGQLTAAFLKHYSIFINPGVSDADLWTMSQGQNETLQSFIGRFKTVMSKVEHVSDKAALLALKKALWYTSDFKKEMTVNTPSTIEDALHRASGFINQEEETTLCAERHGKAKQTNQQPQAQQHQNTKRGNHTPGFVQHEGGFKGAHSFQVESAGRGQGQGNSRGRGQVRGLGRGRDPWNTWVRKESSYDETAYCDHHHVFGHSTANCRVLGLKLAAKLAAGELGGNVSIADFAMDVNNDRTGPADKEGQKRLRQEKDAPPPEQRRRINMIMGGSHYCADTVSSIKAFQRRADVSMNLQIPSTFKNDVIMFEENETVGIDKPHDDPLVVEVVVANCDVARVLIDTGSTMDIIFKETLKRMDIDLTAVKPFPKPVTNFSGETTMTMGLITLPVQAGGVTKNVEFSVSDHPAIYNLILGTPWLNSMRAVASTYHLCVKFPTPSGVKTIRGSQKESRMCFLTEHKLRKPVTDQVSERKKMKTDREPVKGLSKLL